jgi:ribosomal protein L7Ae-like RNA K-turn-binding protein
MKGNWRKKSPDPPRKERKAILSLGPQKNEPSSPAPPPAKVAPAEPPAPPKVVWKLPKQNYETTDLGAEPQQQPRPMSNPQVPPRSTAQPSFTPSSLNAWGQTQASTSIIHRLKSQEQQQAQSRQTTKPFAQQQSQPQGSTQGTASMPVGGKVGSGGHSGGRELEKIDKWTVVDGKQKPKTKQQPRAVTAASLVDPQQNAQSWGAMSHAHAALPVERATNMHGKAAKEALSLFDMINFKALDNITKKKQKEQHEKRQHALELERQAAFMKRQARTKAMLQLQRASTSTGTAVPLKSFGRGSAPASVVDDNIPRPVPAVPSSTAALSNEAFPSLSSFPSLGSAPSGPGPAFPRKLGPAKFTPIKVKHVKLSSAKLLADAAKIKNKNKHAENKLKGTKSKSEGKNKKSLDARKTSDTNGKKPRKAPKKPPKPTKMKKIIVSERDLKWIQEAVLGPIITAVVGSEPPKRRRRRRKRGGPSGPKPFSWSDFARTHPVARDYCRQIGRASIDRQTTELLEAMTRFQERLWIKDPTKAKLRKRYVCGLREVFKGVKAERIKSIVVARNIEPVAAEGGLDALLKSILDLCVEKKVFVIFSLSRRKLGQLLRSPNAKCSAVA